MPYAIIKTPKGKFSLINTATGEVHSKGTTKKKCIAQQRLLEGIEHGTIEGKGYLSDLVYGKKKVKPIEPQKKDRRGAIISINRSRREQEEDEKQMEEDNERNRLRQLEAIKNDREIRQRRQAMLKRSGSSPTDYIRSPLDEEALTNLADEDLDTYYADKAKSKPSPSNEKCFGCFGFGIGASPLIPTGDKDTEMLEMIERNAEQRVDLHGKGIHYHTHHIHGGAGSGLRQSSVSPYEAIDDELDTPLNRTTSSRLQRDRTVPPSQTTSFTIQRPPQDDTPFNQAIDVLGETDDNMVRRLQRDRGKKYIGRLVNEKRLLQQLPGNFWNYIFAYNQYHHRRGHTPTQSQIDLDTVNFRRRNELNDVCRHKLQIVQDMIDEEENRMRNVERNGVREVVRTRLNDNQDLRNYVTNFL